MEWAKSPINLAFQYICLSVVLVLIGLVVPAVLVRLLVGWIRVLGRASVSLLVACVSEAILTISITRSLELLEAHNTPLTYASILLFSPRLYVVTPLYALAAGACWWFVEPRLHSERVALY